MISKLSDLTPDQAVWLEDLARNKSVSIREAFERMYRCEARLFGWKEIANHIGIHFKSAQRLCASDPGLSLIVNRRRSAKGHTAAVWCDKEHLDRWMEGRNGKTQEP